MSHARLASDALALSVAAFSALCIQAQLTSRFTPRFSQNLAEKLPLHNKTVFWWAGLSVGTLRYVFVALNALVCVLLGVPEFRTLGLKVSMLLLFVGFYSDWKLGESPIPHLILCSITGAAIMVR